VHLAPNAQTKKGAIRISLLTSRTPSYLAPSLLAVMRERPLWACTIARQTPLPAALCGGGCETNLSRSTAAATLAIIRGP